MKRITQMRAWRKQLAGLALLPPVLGLSMGAAGSANSVSSAGPTKMAASAAAFTKTEKISRVNLVNGQTQVVDTRTFSVRVDQTRLLRNRQEINVSWSGAHPTGGIFADQRSIFASQEEYPVVLMMCRGQASAKSGKNAISPKTCWTQTSPERVNQDTTSAWPPYRLDLYGSIADRGAHVGVPNPLPKACKSFAADAEHWVPFVAANGHVYNYGPSACAGLPPEAANITSSLAPSNTTYGVTDLQGQGSDKFDVTTAETNSSLGCSDKVPCSLVIIPIMGISCDPQGASIPPADRPPADAVAQAFAECSQTGAFAPGTLAPPNSPNIEDLAVSGQLWWSASNWRNRIMVPLNFAQPSNVCAIVNKSAPVPIYGSYMLLGATQQWAPHFCLNKKLFLLEHVITAEPEAKNLLALGGINAAFEGSPPPAPFTTPTVQAPTALTGFAIVFDIIGSNGQQITTLRLDARLLAKLLTESYPSSPVIGTDDKDLQNPVTHKPNPYDITSDPEFQALNPDIPASIGNLAGASAATMLAVSAGSDAIWSLTSYINDNPEARAWLNGKPDPWGMVVNPKYQGIKLPTEQWPLLDTFVAPQSFQPDNLCIATSPTPWLSLVAAPVESMATITLDLQFNVSNSQVNCNNGQFPSYGSVGPEIPGQTFILGFTSLADAMQYKLATAELETQGGSTSNTQFTTSAGRTFVAPTDASLRAAAAMMKPDDTTGSWTVPYAQMEAAKAGKSAYPGTMLISTDVPTKNLTSSQARDYGKFLSFAAGAGQHSGFGNGQLPPGYLPLTAANGAAKMLAYTRAAATDVTAQNGKVPHPTGGQSAGQPGGGHHSQSPGPSPTTSASTSPGSNPSPSIPSGTPSAGSGGSSSVGLPPVTTSPGASLPPIATTADVQSKISGALLPIVLLVALVAATVAFGIWQLRRQTVSK